jgi:hypothetical protein
MAVPLQLGFTVFEQIYAKKKTCRQRFLDEMEITVPWDMFLALIEPVYHKPAGGQLFGGQESQAGIGQGLHLKRRAGAAAGQEAAGETGLLRSGKPLPWPS